MDKTSRLLLTRAQEVLENLSPCYSQQVANLSRAIKDFEAQDEASHVAVTLRLIETIISVEVHQLRSRKQVTPDASSFLSSSKLGVNTTMTLRCNMCRNILDTAPFDCNTHAQKVKRVGYLRKFTWKKALSMGAQLSAIRTGLMASQKRCECTALDKLRLSLEES